MERVTGLMLCFICVIRTVFQTEQRPLRLTKNTRVFNPLWGAAVKLFNAPKK